MMYSYTCFVKGKKASTGQKSWGRFHGTNLWQKSMSMVDCKESHFTERQMCPQSTHAFGRPEDSAENNNNC